MTATDANARRLLIDDDADLRQMMREYFARQGFDLATVPDGPRGLEAALVGKFDRGDPRCHAPRLDRFGVLCALGDTDPGHRT